jgi:CHAT domain-containing protein
MLLWLNPFKWWRTFQLKRRWKRVNGLFIDSYHRQDWVAAESAAISMVDILAGSGLRSLLLDSHYSLMLCYRSMGRFDEAITSGELVLDLQRSLSANPDDLRVLERMCDLADLYNSAGRVDDAIKLYGQALAAQRRIDGGRDSKQLVDTLEGLAAIYVGQEQGDRAQKLFDEAQGYRRKLGLVADDDELDRAIKKIKSRHKGEPLTDLEQWQNLMIEASKLYESGDIPAAIPISEQALELAEKIFSDYNSDLAISLNFLAVLYFSQGHWADAEPLFLKALAIRSKLFPDPDKPNSYLATSLNNLAGLYFSQGRWADAEPLFLKALAIRSKLFPDPNKPNNDLATSLSNLAGLYLSQGRWTDAEPLFLKALGIFQKLFPDPNKPNNDLATSLSNLAGLYRSQGRWADAEPLFLKALGIRNKLFPDPNKPNNDLATSLNNLAGLYRSQGRWADAEPLYIKALGIFQKLFPDPNKPNNYLATSLNNLAALYQAQGRWADAEPLCANALGILQKLFGKNGHPNLVTSLTNLAINQARLQPDLALPLLQQAITTENYWFTKIIPNKGSQQRLKDLEESQKNLEYLLALTKQHFSQDPTAANIAFNAVLSRKAQAANAEASFNQAIRNYPHLAPQLQQLQDYQQEIANLSYAVGNQPELIDQINNLLQQRSNLERKLSKSVPALDLQQQVVDRLALSDLLPLNSFLIEFVRYDDYDFANSKWLDARYLAFIIKQDTASITMLDCGLAEPLDKAINNFRNTQAKKDFGGQNSGLSDFLKHPTTENMADFLDRLLPHLPTNGTCFFAADSHLHILPFHLLKKSDGEYLGDQYQIHYLNTARDLLRRQIEPSPNPPLVLTAPDYDGSNVIPLPQVQDTILPNPKIDFQASDGVEEEPFEPLPINKILGELVADAYQVPCYSGTEATVDRFKQVNAPKLLMIATHGFSKPPQTLLEMLCRCPIDQEEEIISKHQKEITSGMRDFCQKQAEQGSQDSQRILAIIDRYGIRPKNTDILNTPTSDPMLRCGFALAGANIWRFKGVESPQFGKGIIFAQDVMQCNLWGTELAIIATCVSGMGEVKNSEGVFGLRRALAIAGAKYVITSLWSIPTKPSALLMEKFFEFYKSGLPPAVALSNAQKDVRDITLGALKGSQLGLEVIDELKEGYMQISDDTSDDFRPLSHPYFWGAWICQG